MKINSLITGFGVFSLLFLASSCSTRKPWYEKSQRSWATAGSPDSLKLLYSVFLVGDVGNPDKNRQEPTLKLLQNQVNHRNEAAIARADTANTTREEDAVIFLGDNIYESGLPEPDAVDRKEKERRIIEQMNVVKGFRGRAIFVPGNHDWHEMGPKGLETVNREERFVEEYLKAGDVFLPSNGCGGPVEIRMNNDLVIIAIDTQWWLHKYEKPLAPDNGCSVSSRPELISQVKDIILRNKGKNILIAQHHPLFSNGTHGGHFTLKDYFFPLTLLRDNAYIPLPLIGSIYPLLRQYGIARQDLSNKDYQQLKRGLLSILEDEKNVVLATGHEHALQFNKYKDLNHIISGAGSKSNRLIKGNGASFTHGTKGFARVNYYDNGQCWVEFWEPEGDGAKGKLMYRTPLYAIPPKGIVEAREEKLMNYKDSTKVLAAGDSYRAGKFQRQLYGEHYRESWATPVKVKYLDPSVFAGGLTPVKMGGGHQTTSLQLQGKDGNLYQFRLIDKDPSRLLPEGFLKTFAEDFVQDQISSAHPYGAMAVPDMAKAIGIYYASPQLVYMPNSSLLGPYIQQVGGKMGYIEARPDEDVSDFKSFGNAANAISTKKLYEKLRDDNDNEVDQKMFLKARLFDILIGDWDRHEDQWRWAEFKKEKGSVYRPIPRDRDQAFAKYDGLLPSIASKAIPDLQSFTYDINNAVQLSIAARNLDRNFLNKLSADDFLKAADEISAKLTDAVITSSVKKMPPEAFAQSGEEIIAKLKSRRGQLSTAAVKYYEALSKVVTVAGTDKKEFFKIEQLPESTKVQIFKIDSNEKVSNKIFERTFHSNETKEINLFALAGKDSLTVTDRDAARAIKVRFVGGDGKDDINTSATSQHVIVYDNKEGNHINAGKRTTLRLSKDDSANFYDPDAFEYDKKGPIPYGDFNGDDGLFVGLGYGIKKYGFRKDPYAYETDLAGAYAPKSGAYLFRYRGTFYSVLGKNNDIIATAKYNSPKYTINYYGEGNSTENIDNDNLFYRLRTQNLSASLLFQHRFTKAFKMGIGPGFEYYKVTRPEKRFVNTAAFPEKEQVEVPARFGTVRSYLDIDFVDNPVFPGSGVKFRTEANYFNESGGTNFNSLQLKTIGSFYATPNFSFPVTLALRAGAAKNYGDYKFYQTNSLGSNSYLRGYRNNRFSGRSYVFQNTELRFKLTDLRNYIFTGNLGVFGFYDSGRVYSASAESGNWHHGYGPGVWINFYNKFLVTTAYGISGEGKYFTFTAGMPF
ncbi:BamA/TamA family outer membrane protein [Hufsiella ginkgonis]|uniref:BamA/TamA family outer membrane protein n=1 Tax=Hufsiella ginkgonis TaxID=2695274 RepID=A0A7K1Y372_9SPHI|nr:metallophosphoesterase [Hufsiella ginkgonis]MXV17710.1 BamA/TamA family outer membrane protein [Hufsiella ginkgonis]